MVTFIQKAHGCIFLYDAIKAQAAQLAISDSLRKDSKERRRLELVQKRCTIGEFHRVYYWPALGRGRYHSMSYQLAA